MYCDAKHVTKRLLVIDALARTSNVEQTIPISVAKVCEKYYSEAIYWSICRDELEYLSSHHSAAFSNRTIKIGSFQFYLHLRNDRHSIIFEVIPLQIPSQCTDYIYCELYCVETQSQHKYTFLFNTKTGSKWVGHPSTPRLHLRRYPALQWSSDHLKLKEMVPQPQRLTFSFRGRILPNKIPKSLHKQSGPRKIEYIWNLEDETKKNGAAKSCKIYSPNFGDDAWCLWMAPSKERECNIIGLQLFRNITGTKKGIMFRCKIEREGYGGRMIEFMYHLDLTHCQLEIGNIKRESKWIRVEIEREAECERMD